MEVKLLEFQELFVVFALIRFSVTKTVVKFKAVRVLEGDWLADVILIDAFEVIIGLRVRPALHLTLRDDLIENLCVLHLLDALVVSLSDDAEDSFPLGVIGTVLPHEQILVSQVQPGVCVIVGDFEHFHFPQRITRPLDAALQRDTV